MTRLELPIESADISLLVLKVLEIFIVRAGVDVGICYLARLDIFGFRLHGDISMLDLEGCAITGAQVCLYQVLGMVRVQGGHDGLVDPLIV